MLNPMGIFSVSPDEHEWSFMPAMELVNQVTNMNRPYVNMYTEEQLQEAKAAVYETCIDICIETKFPIHRIREAAEADK